MKKIIVNGGEFYKLYPVSNITADFGASTLVDIATVTSGKIYRIEIRGSYLQPTIYGGGNYYAKEAYTQRYVVDDAVIYTIRCEHTGTLQMRFPSAQGGVNVKVYEYSKFEYVKFKMPLSTANEVSGSDSCNVFLMPTLVSGTTYKMVVQPLWTGFVQVYGSDNTSILDKTACTSGDVFEINYACGANNGYPKIRSFVENEYCNFKINV